MVKKSTVQDAIQELMTNKFETYGVRCPRCGTLLLRPKTVDRVTGKKLPGACPGMVPDEAYSNRVSNHQVMKPCGYKEPIAIHTIPDSEELTTIAHRNDVLGYLRTFSVLSSMKVLQHRFENYQVNGEPERAALQKCQRIANEIAAGKTIHSLLIGQTGRGKTHLAMGIVYSILEQTGYKTVRTITEDGKPVKKFDNWKVLFVDWRELIERQKQAFNDDTLKRKVNKCLAEIRLADVVVLDDFGSERDSDYSRDLVDHFWRDRENKTVIVTTNLEGNGLEKRYGARTLSRMKNYGVGNSIAFSAIRDYRGIVQ
ncbi:P-loop NTPase family protein [Lactiplantibacillus pentosus]|uniref:ATP-binding protein n=1 Tax=Lactiplantibacillus pentosus TaxID=1589 RepID=UPI00067BBE3D|nr:ATP-binding protein [Lactiplantibacillus pentosus]MCC3164551.1 ATP-binding protein [Lactiplantibacillus pentosus]MCJ8180976.1 ATP-binding protein [Lactiplantibacillus pentosus]MCJ8189677.1 ATP-binding protein [Lactiplantibacillus pentosus]